MYDTNKKIIGWLDIYPKNFKLEVKGDYTLQAQVRHHSQEILEKFNNTVCLLDYNISKKVNLNVYSQIPDVFALEKSALGRFSLEKDAKKAIFIGSPVDYSVYPKEGKPGDLLLGRFNLLNSVKVDGGQYHANLIIPPAPTKPKETPLPSGNGGDKEGNPIITGEEGTGKQEETTTEEEKIDNELMESIRDLQISYLKKFPANSRARKLLTKELESNYPNHLPLFITNLELLLESFETATGGSGGEDASLETAHKICELADELLKKVDLNELAQYYGIKQDTNANEIAKKKKKENDEKKKAVILSYRAKAQALAFLSETTSSSSTTSSNELDTLFEKTWKELAQWLDSTPPTSDFKNLQIYINRERKAHRFGNALKALNKYLNEVGLTSDAAKEYEKALDLKFKLLTDLEWEIWKEYEKRWKLIRIPPGGYVPLS